MLLILVLPVVLISLVGATQQPLKYGWQGPQGYQAPLGHESNDDGLFSPLEDLSVLTATEYTTLAHPAFPKYEVRIKKSDFCDGTVRSVAPL